MRSGNYIKLFVFAMLVATGLVLLSYTHIHPTNKSSNTECSDGETCGQKKIQTEFILWESLSQSLLGNND
jgi:hypothetical protein